MIDDLTGDGMIIIDGVETETVYHWLTVSPVAGPVIAEGSITGSEQLLKKVKGAGATLLWLSASGLRGEVHDHAHDGRDADHRIESLCFHRLAGEPRRPFPRFAYGIRR
jgi:hypothetical protein